MYFDNDEIMCAVSLCLGPKTHHPKTNKIIPTIDLPRLYIHNARVCVHYINTIHLQSVVFTVKIIIHYWWVRQLINNHGSLSKEIVNEMAGVCDLTADALVLDGRSQNRT